MSIELRLDPDISLQGVQGEMAQGVSAIRSAHVGNARGYNLAVAFTGIPMLFVDHNIASQSPDEKGDRNYLPGSIVTREGVSPMALGAVGGLALRTTTTCPEGRFQRYVDEVHMMSMRAAFPETLLVSNTEYLRNEEGVARAVVAATLATHPQLFNRKIEAGEAVPLKAREGQTFAQDVAKYGIMQLNDYPRTERGVLMPNETDIVASFVIEALRSGRDTQIHLSGPDMQQYTKDPTLLGALSGIYREVKRTAQLGDDLPETLKVRLVPADQAQFITTQGRANKLQAVFDLLAQQPALKEEKRVFFAGNTAKDPAAREAFLDEMSARETELTATLGEAVGSCDEILGDPKGAPFLSQYDLLAEGGISMPDANTSLTMRELKQIAKILQKAKGKTICVPTP